jgi:predicted DNA-binding transcriptional regulator YafY
MRRGDRLFEVIQHLRTATRPVTAARLAEELEVTVRTVYRDIAALQARRVPIEGAPGIGYVLRKGFDLPPLMFTLEEVEAIVVGARLTRRTGDHGLQQAAESVLSKITVILPQALREHVAAAPFFVSPSGAAAAPVLDLSAVRDAIRERRKIRLTYKDEEGRRTHRTVRPIAIAYYVEATLVAAWCELRQGFRHFRADRVVTATILDERFEADAKELTGAWLALRASEEAAAGRF